MMFEKLPRKSLTATLAALTAALGVGGIAMAQNSGSSASPSSTAAPSKAVDTPEPGDRPDANEKGEVNDQNEANDQETNDDGPGHVDQGDGDGETADDAPAT